MNDTSPSPDGGHENPVIYLDNGTTTPCDPRVVEVMLPYFTDVPFSPTSSVHPLNRRVEEAVENARWQVARSIGASRKEIIFTSGATESNNLALFGLAQDAPLNRRHIVTSKIEHKSVLATCRELGRRGFIITELPVDRNGVIDLAAAEAAINERTLLVTIQAANGDVGTIQPIKKLAALAHIHGAVFHSDAAQSLGRVPLDVVHLDVDLLSITAHKCYGPKGIGALYLRGGPSSTPIYPLILGGNQEQGIRAGTLNIPGIVGFGEACRMSMDLQPDESQRIRHFRRYFEEALQDRCADVLINAAGVARLPGTSSITIEGVDADALVVNIPSVIFRVGSGCVSAVPEPMSTLLAMQLTAPQSYQTMHVCFGRFNIPQHARLVARLLSEAIEQLRAFRSSI